MTLSWRKIIFASFTTASLFLLRTNLCSADQNLRSSSRQLDSVIADGNEHYHDSHPDARVLTEDERPVMHTFYNRIDPNVHHKYGGMTDESDAQLLLVWEAAWKAAGWKTRIVTLEDAKKHPDYEKFDKLLDLEKMPFGFYDKLCFMRWLAMAAVGGGFMSDYDTFPLRYFAKMKDLPRGGKLTVYDTVRSGGVPSVVSGSGKEFDRMAHALLYNTLQKGVREEFWSDMFALMDVYTTDNDVYLLFDQVVKGNAALAGVKNGLSSLRECKAVVGGNFAVHFSHFSITDSVAKGHLPKGQGAADRPKIADQFLKNWAKYCPDLVTQEYHIGG